MKLAERAGRDPRKRSTVRKRLFTNPFADICVHMPRVSKIKLSRLRDIGWTLWDPIGLSEGNGVWPEDCPDEYDPYLLHAAHLLQSGNAREEVADHLKTVASERMGLPISTQAAAKATADAIADYLASL